MTSVETTREALLGESEKVSGTVHFFMLPPPLPAVPLA